MGRTDMDNLAKKLYRCYAFGEELDDEWAEGVLAASEARRIPVDRLIDDLARDAESMLRVTSQWELMAGNGDKKKAA